MSAMFKSARVIGVIGDIGELPEFSKRCILGRLPNATGAASEQGPPSLSAPNGGCCSPEWKA
jgi:hypothetical protein